MPQNDLKSHQVSSGDSAGHPDKRSGAAKRGAFVGILLLLLPSLGIVNPGREPVRRALIIAISVYADSDVPTINADDDVALIRSALEHHAFDDVQVLRNEQATHDAILSSLDNLVRSSDVGDVVVLHVSSHGTQLADDNGDEFDQLDEALLPHDAPAANGWPLARQNAYLASDDIKHIRDDVLDEYVSQLRRKVGTSGQVIVWLDSCHSGTGTRDPQGPQPRGFDEPIGRATAPANRSASRDQAGIFESTANHTADAVLGPFVAISAARQGERNWETTDGRGRPVGSLSFALNRALISAQPGESFRVLFERVAELMSQSSPLQNPQLEGDADAGLFNGRMNAQVPYFNVTSINVNEEKDPPTTTVRLSGGSLAGLIEGTTVDFYPRNTPSPSASAESPLAQGVVTASKPGNASVELDGVLSSESLQSSWAFVASPGFGQMRVRLRLDSSIQTTTLATIHQVLEDLPVVEVSSTTADVLVREERGVVILETATGHRQIGESLPVRSDLRSQLGSRILDYARNAYLKQVDLGDAAVDVKLTLVPATHTYDRRGRCTVSDTTAFSAIKRAGYWELHDGDGYILSLTNSGTEDAFVAILGLWSDGSISQLFPDNRMTPDEAVVAPGSTLRVRDICYEAAPPFGIDVLKVFASSGEPFRFDAILNRSGGRRGEGSGDHFLEQLMAGAHSGRGILKRRQQSRKYSTHAIKVAVVPRTSPGDQVP